ncbi:MAG: hypothetical protein ACKO96_22415 [Flammeovirgaceae bacterium]
MWFKVLLSLFAFGVGDRAQFQIPARSQILTLPASQMKMRVRRQLTLTIITILTSCILTSCDPAKLIILKNKSDKPAYFKWTIEVDSVSGYSNHPALKTEIFDLGTKKEEREKVMYFGFGSWPTGEIERFVNKNVKSIEIEGANTKVKMTDKREIIKFLTDRRHGLFKNFITIKIH